MDSLFFINILVVIFSVLSIAISIVFITYSQRVREQREKLQVKRKSQEVQSSEPNDTMKDRTLTSYKVNAEIWKSLEDIIGGLKELSSVTPYAVVAFLSTVQILLDSYLQSLGVNKKPGSFPNYENISFMIMINDTDESIHYSKGWTKGLIPANEFYQDGVTITSIENEYFEYQFRGTGINCFIGIQPSNEESSVDIYLDRKYIGEKEIPNTPKTVQLSILQITDLKRKVHTIKIVLKKGVLALDAIGIYT